MFYEKRGKKSCRGGNRVGKLAFTLAEVLLTLGIIGVVVVLTIFALVGKYSDMQKSVALKKAYTNLSQAILMSQQEHGELVDWDRAPYHRKGMLEWSLMSIFLNI